MPAGAALFGELFRMNLLARLLLAGCLLLPALLRAEDAAAAGSGTADHLTTDAAAAVAGGYASPRTPDFLEHLVDVILELFDVKTSGNTPTHYGIALLLLLGAFVLRHVVTKIVFGFLKKFAARTKTTLDDKLFPALETPASALIVVLGAVCALKVLKLSAAADETLAYAYTAGFSLVLFWLLLRAFNTILDHVHEVARERQLGIAAFMPWIKKTLATIVFVFGVLLIAQSLGADVKAFLAGLGIGGLAFALAAQDTIANVFGSVVVAVDQPFKLGEFVRIGNFLGMVEDIGLRSTRLRALDKSLIVIPNKTVAAEAVVNLSRFTQRRVEQVIGLTYDTKAEKMDAIVEEIRRLILSEPEVDPDSVLVYFRDYNASSLDIWIVYVVKNPDFKKHMALRQRLNLAFMRAVEARGLSFAFPTQTLHLEGEVARQLAGRKE
ncbi:MAG: mechanosensitive ion channel protein MscS [Verrucomicrobia bacterium RIFCSPLOWO2_12_FULL_64_8]|nr:MAG: mechanosensitive ion channel protein MscS [Verrucomicrobia bacterium RIFCSPLOWO2_12_FULL_64_8]